MPDESQLPAAELKLAKSKLKVAVKMHQMGRHRRFQVRTSQAPRDTQAEKEPALRTEIAAAEAAECTSEEGPSRGQC